MNWANMKTGEHEYFDGLPPKDRMKEFLPQGAGAGMFDCLLKMGKTEEEAFEQVLETAYKGV